VPGIVIPPTTTVEFPNVPVATPQKEALPLLSSTVMDCAGSVFLFLELHEKPIWKTVG
jgi:hypothetical protein